MKKILILFCALCTYCAAVKGQFLKAPGSGVHTSDIFSTFDDSGNLLVTQISGQLHDTVEIKKYNHRTGNFSVFNIFSIGNRYYHSFWTTGFFRKDTLYLAIYGIDKSTYVGNWFFLAITQNNVKTIGRTWSQNGPDYNLYAISGFYPLKNKIAVFGGMDSIVNGANRIKSNGFAVFDGNKWSTGADPGGAVGDVAVVNDTILIYSNTSKKMVYPGSWSNVTLPGSSLYFSGLAPIKNGFVIGNTNYNNKDSFCTFINGKFSPWYGGFNFYNSPLKITICETSKGLMGLHNGELLKFNNSKKKFEAIYKFSKFDSSMNQIYFNDTHIYLSSYKDIRYKNKNYSKLAEVDPDSAKPYGYDTLVLLPFWDRNKNYTYETTDTFLRNPVGIDETYSNYIYWNNGQNYTWVVPDYNDVDVNLYYYNSYDTCFQLPFSGNLRSSNTSPGKTRDTLFFPLWRTSLYKEDLQINVYTTKRQRYKSPNFLYLGLFNRDCDYSIRNCTVSLAIDANITIKSSNPPYSSRVGDTVKWNVTNLYPFQYQQFALTLDYDTAKFHLGDKIHFYTKITTTAKEDPAHNDDSMVSVISNSYDPNVKYSQPEGTIKENVKEIKYFIHFQNLGNDDAYRVTVIDTLDLRIPVYEFQMIYASHPYTVSLKKNIVTWVFDDINLAPKSQSEEGSKGYIYFKAVLKKDFKPGDSIRNRAAIYFDYNKPVLTNYAVIRSLDTNTAKLQKLFQSKNSALTCYPVPASQELNFLTNGNDAGNISIYQVSGKLQWQGKIKKGEILTVNCSNWSKGLYIAQTKNGAIKIMIE